MDQLASKHFQARMLKRYTHREQQLCSVLKIATNVQENAEDILAEAKQINKDREESEAEEVLEAEAFEETLAEE